MRSLERNKGKNTLFASRIKEIGLVDGNHQFDGNMHGVTLNISLAKSDGLNQWQLSVIVS